MLTSLISSILTLFILNIILNTSILLIINQSILSAFIISLINISNTYLLFIIIALKLTVSS